MYMAPAHHSGRVSQYTEKKTKEGRPVLGFINSVLASDLQVCDLVSNKEFKALIKKAYMKWRAEFLMAERAKTPNDKFRRIKIKIQVFTMTNIVEDSTNYFNYEHRTSMSIKKALRFAGQDPWVEITNDFKAHLNSLDKPPLYLMVENVLEHRTPVKLPGAFELKEDEESAVQVLKSISYVFNN